MCTLGWEGPCSGPAGCGTWFCCTCFCQTCPGRRSGHEEDQGQASPTVPILEPLHQRWKGSPREPASRSGGPVRPRPLDLAVVPSVRVGHDAGLTGVRMSSDPVARADRIWTCDPCPQVGLHDAGGRHLPGGSARAVTLRQELGKGRRLSEADRYPGVLSRSLLRARLWACPVCTSLTHSQPGLADGPMRGSLGAWPSRKAWTYARSWLIRART
jgi:hypothetical protein